MKPKAQKKFWLSLIIFSLMGQVAWVVENMYFNVFLYKMFHATAGDISLMVAASSVAAALTTLLVGAFSDKVGKRKIFICGGYMVWGVSILSFALLRMDLLTPLCGSAAAAASMGVSLVILMDCVMTFFGSSANDAAFNAWLTDCGDSNTRGRIEGINAMMPLVAILVVFGGFLPFNLDQPNSWTAIYCIIGGAVLLIGLLGFFLIEDHVAPGTTERSYRENVLYSFRPSVIRENRYLYAAVGCFAAFNISIQIFMPYLILYYEKSLGMQNYVLVLAPAILLAAAATAYYGGQYDRLGFVTAVNPTVYLLMGGYVLLYFGRSFLPVFLGSLLMMTGYLTGMAVFGALIKSKIPADKAGLFQGLRIFGQVLVPGIIGPAIGAAVLRNAQQISNSDGTTSFLPNQNIFLAAFVAAAVLLVLLQGLFAMQRNGHWPLTTPAGEALRQSPPQTPWGDYPRPQLRRESYLSLNGSWQLNGQPVLVPFAPQAPLSGYGGRIGPHLHYTRQFSVPKDFWRQGKDERVLLHFGAVDQVAAVFVNGSPAVRHEGGYLPFSADITNLLRPGKNELTVQADDALRHRYPYGKQSKKRGGMWYTPVSGIWQSVWLECVPAKHITALTLTPDLDGVTLTVRRTDPALPCTVVISLGDAGMLNTVLQGDSVYIRLRGALPQTEPNADGTVQKAKPYRPRLWTPDDPFLYSFSVTCGQDTVQSYFALRTISIVPAPRPDLPARLCLNGKPIFLHGVLDQGYFPDGLFLPADAQGYARDIRRMKELGFNTLRKHIKVEPEAFYAACDAAGMLVVQDMVNNGPYHFIRDTALPTLGILKRGDTGPALLCDSTARRAFFEAHCRETQEHLYNHPCVVGYTVFNEGWGQFESDRVTADCRLRDPSRFYDATSGWFQQKQSDVDSRHLYFKTDPPLTDPDRQHLPLFLSEFGGYACPLPGHLYSKYGSFGYGAYSDCAELTQAVCSLYRTIVLPAVAQGLCGCIYTQLSDIEDEVNGLYTYDRRVCKLQPQAMRQLSKELYRTFAQAVEPAAEKKVHTPAPME